MCWARPQLHPVQQCPDLELAFPRGVSLSAALGMRTAPAAGGRKEKRTSTGCCKLVAEGKSFHLHIPAFAAEVLLHSMHDWAGPPVLLEFLHACTGDLMIIIGVSTPQAQV